MAIDLDAGEAGGGAPLAEEVGLVLGPAVAGVAGREHWIYLRTTNPIESTFATVRLRQRVTKGPGSQAAGVAMAVKLIESALARWRTSTHPTWSPWSALARGSRTANSSNDPTNREVISKPRDRGGHETGRHVGQRNFRVGLAA
jgi:hypothetical protein